MESKVTSEDDGLRPLADLNRFVVPRLRFGQGHGILPVDASNESPNQDTAVRRMLD